MASPENEPPSNVAPDLAWTSLVERSLEAWKSLKLNTEVGVFQTSFLQRYKSLDELLSSGLGHLMFWFFQRRDAFLSQKRMSKWSRTSLDDYILFPANNGFVNRIDCFFLSHFWHSKDHPDPDGKYLRLIQDDLQSQEWSYIWVDWTCIPQHPRSPTEEAFFVRTLQTVSGIIRNCGFMWYYPPFEPRMWILYEVAENLLTSEGPFFGTEDIRAFIEHIQEMLEAGVRPTLEKYGYNCSYDRDKDFLTSWLEVLVLLKKLRFDVDVKRRLLDALTWGHGIHYMYLGTTKGAVTFMRQEGTLDLNGKRYTFTPFPNWVSCTSRCRIWADRDDIGRRQIFHEHSASSGMKGPITVCVKGWIYTRYQNNRLVPRASLRLS